MATSTTQLLPRPSDANTDYTADMSLTRIWQLITTLEGGSDELLGSGIIEGGAVTTTAAYTVQLATGTVVWVQGKAYTLASAISRDVTGANLDVQRVYGVLTRTTGGNSDPTTEDSWTFALTHTTNTETPPSDQAIPVTVATLGAAAIDTLQDPPGKFVRNRPHYGWLTKAVAGAGATTTLTEDEARCGIVKLTGVRTGNLALVLPTQAGRIHIVHNATSGAFTTTVKTAAGTGVVVPVDAAIVVHCDGTNILAGSLPVTASSGGFPLALTDNVTIEVNAGLLRIKAGALAATAAGRALMATNLFDAATLTDKLAADCITNAVLLDAVLNGAFVADDATRALFAAGFLGATAVGRALMATGYFDAAKVADAFGADSFTNAVLLQLVQNGAFVADADTRALFADGFLPAAKLAFEPAVDAGRPATGHIRMLAAGNDADTITVTVGAAAVVYELESGGGVTGGNIAVTIGGTAAETATNLRAAINTNQSGVLASAVHGTDTDTVDVRVLVAGTTLALAESTAGARVAVQDNAEEVAAADRVLYPIRRTVTTEDVTRGRIRIDTGLSNIDSYSVDILTSATDYTRIAWAGGAATVTGGVLELDNAGGTDWAAGNVVVAWVWGRQ